MALSVPNNHKYCVHKLDVLRHVIHPQSMLDKGVLLTRKQGPRPVPCVSNNENDNRVETDQAACKVVKNENLWKEKEKHMLRKRTTTLTCKNFLEEIGSG